METQETVALQRAYFETGATLSPAFRKRQLRRLRAGILAREADILAALRQDLGKAPFEGFATEVAVVLDELEYMLKHFERFARPRLVPPTLSQLPGYGRRLPEPYGVALILSPWNYPFHLSFAPLVGALAAGNCAVVKPASDAPATARVMAELLRDLFDERYVSVVEGGRAANTALLEQPFDMIFFTGSTAVGHVVMEAAARHLTPVVLELGGKSPCIVDETADLRLAARRIAWGKFVNAGQTCVAPDYVLAHRSVRGALVRELRRSIAALYGDDPLRSPDLPRIVNRRHFDRLTGLLAGAGPVLGGRSEGLRLEPTLLPLAGWDCPAMQEEIFGPILPVLAYDSLPEALAQLRRRPRPLALYLFTRSRAAQRQVLALPFGGGCVNDTLMHLGSPRMPFGGVGASGMGSYHGRASFEAFSHSKSVYMGSRLDLPVRYPPYGDRLERLRRFFPG